MTLHPEVHKALLLFSFSLGCWTLLTLLLSRRGERRARLTMAAFVALLMLPPLQAYVALARGGEPLLWLQSLSYRLTWAYGPLLMLCVQQALLLPVPSSRQILVHALPFLTIGLGAMSGAAGMASALWVWLLLLQVLAYAVYGLVLLQRHRSRLQQLAQCHRNTSYYWLLFLALGLLLTCVFDLVVHALAQQGHLPPLSLLQAAAWGLALYVNVIALFAVYQPEVFMARPEPVVESPRPVDPTEASKPMAPRALELSPEAARDLAEQLRALALKAKPHHDEDMSLAKLAALLEVSPHQLSELLNLHMGSSFYDYLNELRYLEALQLLEQDDAHQSLTVADIAYRAGFNNRNSFYKVFKDKTGVTPAQYRKNWAKQA